MPLLDSKHEAVLTEAARVGSHDAFDELFAAYRPTVVNVAYRVTLHWDDAQDVAQIVCLRAYRSFGSFSPDASMRGWLSTITRHCAIDELRRRKRSQREAGVHHGDEATPEAERTAANDGDVVLHAALASLPNKYRTPLDLFYFRELTYNEISVRLDLPLNTVKTHISRGKRRLKREIEDARA